MKFRVKTNQDRRNLELLHLPAARQTLEECMDHLSVLRLGVNLKILSDIPVPVLNELFILSLPAHLQKNCQQRLNDVQKDVVRARIVREKFASF